MNLKGDSRTSGPFLGVFAIGVVLLLASAASAHVKWFVPYDVTKPPTPIGEVLSGYFVMLFLISVAGIYLFFVGDRWMYKRGIFVKLDESLRKFDRFGTYVMRASAGLFFFLLWLWWMLYAKTFYITPELSTTAVWVPWLHLALAACLISRYTAPLAGLGVFALFAAATGDYGIFHMLDYMIFLGIGYFLIAANLNKPKWLRSAFIVLFACTGLTLIWASVEKFGYAEWTFPLLEHDPGMTMGMSPRTFMTLSGFVEFNITFALLGAVSIVGRLMSLGAMSIFVLAVFKFGAVDALGHLMIVAILVVLIVRGPTDARNMLHLSTKSVWTEAYFMTGLYFLAFVMIFILYYGLHWLIYGI
ncbi:MAG: hypothetical protein JO053_14310 [Acidobacteria bacterium]|nr:hypothetical protein [Acidobacteriota bacterium]